jgi:flavin-dependent thymidylate synthase
MLEQLRWKKYPVLNDGHICLVDVMGDDAAIVQAARISYGKDEKKGNFQELFLDIEGVSDQAICERGCIIEKVLGSARFIVRVPDEVAMSNLEELWGHAVWSQVNKPVDDKDRNLIRYLLAHGHTTPFEMVEFKFRVRVPMDCWRQWIRHRTASVNEYSTRYTEAIDAFQTTEPNEWRLQASSNKQGSEGFLEEWPEDWKYEQDENGNFRVGPNEELFHVNDMQTHPAVILSESEETFHKVSKRIYQERLALGVAKEQARKDLPLSTYTEAYWKCDLHNIFNFLRLRMDSHAQYEIRMYANAMAEIVKQIVPVAWEAFEDYVLYAKRFSRMEMEMLRDVLENGWLIEGSHDKPDSMTQREWKEFLEKLA